MEFIDISIADFIFINKEGKVYAYIRVWFETNLSKNYNPYEYLGKKTSKLN